MLLRNILLSLIFLTLFSTVSFSAPTTIFSCTEINDPGQYNLTGMFLSDSSTSCINITVSDVELDCVGNTIQATGISPYPAILIYNSSNSLSNISINNCYLNDFDSGISIQNSSGVNVTNSHLASSSTLVDLGGPAVLVNNSSSAIVANMTTQGYNMSVFTLNSSFVNITNLSTQWSSSGNSSSSISIGINQSSDILVVELNSSNRHIGLEAYDSVRITMANSSIYVPDAVDNCGDIYLNNINQSTFTNISGTRTFNGFYGVNMVNSQENVFTLFNLSGNGATAFAINNSSNINLSSINLVNFAFAFDLKDSFLINVSNSNNSEISYALFNISNTSNSSFDNIMLQYNNSWNTLPIFNSDSFNNSFNLFNISGDTDNFMFMNNTNSNLTILNNSVFGYGCALFSDSNQIQVNNITYQKSGVSSCGSPSGGVKLDHSNQVNLSNISSIQNANQNAIVIFNSSVVSLVSSNFSGSSTSLMYFADSSILSVNSISIDNGAIFTSNLSNVNLTYSNISVDDVNNVNAFACTLCNNSLISNSIFNSSNSTNQISFAQSNDTTISNNNISNSPGPSFSNSNGTSIIGNLFYNSSEGVNFDSLYNTNISSNIFYNLTSAIYGASSNSGYSNLTIDNNSFYNLTCTSYCFYISQYEYVNFTNNNYSLSEHGVQFNSVSYLNLSLNNLFNISGVAITLNSVPTNEFIENNNISNSLFAIQINDGGSFVHILSNNIFDNWIGAINVITAEANISNNTFSNNNPSSSNASVLGLSGIQGVLFGESPLADISSLGSLVIVDNNTMSGGLSGFMSIASLVVSTNNTVYNKSGDIVYSKISNFSSTSDHYYNSSSVVFTNSSNLFFDTGIEVSGYFYDPSASPISNTTYLSLIPTSGSPVDMGFNGSSNFTANATHIEFTSSNGSDSTFSQDYSYVEGSLINHTFYFNTSVLTPATLDYSVDYVSNDGDTVITRNITLVLTNSTSTYVYNYTLPAGYTLHMIANGTLINFTYTSGSGYTEFVSFENYDPLTSINMTVSFELPANVTYAFGEDATLLNFTNLILDGSTDGDLSSYNYTNISFTDIMAGGENSSYLVKWSSLFDGPATPYQSLSNQSFNISSVGQFSPTIDQIFIYWTDVQLAGLDESLFNLHRSTGSAWYANNIDQSIDAASNYLNISSLSIFGQFSVLEGLSLSSSSPCTSCGDNNLPKPSFSVSITSNCNESIVSTSASDVEITISSYLGDTLYSGNTDQNGRAIFAPSCGADLQISAQKSGYRSYYSRFVVDSCSCLVLPLINNSTVTEPRPEPPVKPPAISLPQDNQTQPPPITPNVSNPTMQIYPGSFVGDLTVILVTNCDGCTINLILPNSRSKFLTTDSSGRVSFNADLEGNYQVNLVRQGTVEKSNSFSVRSRPIPEIPISQSDNSLISIGAFALILIAILAAIFFILRRRN